MTDHYLLFQTMSNLSTFLIQYIFCSPKKRWGCKEEGEWNVNSVNHSL